LREAGLSLAKLCDLALKHLYLHGSLTGGEVAAHLKLPFSIVEEGLAFLRRAHCVEVGAGEMAGEISFRYQLTEMGRSRGREAFSQCRYVGPAPVPLGVYAAQCRRQSLSGTACDAASLSGRSTICC
jgi:hypothetical protein